VQKKVSRREAADSVNEEIGYLLTSAVHVARILHRSFVGFNGHRAAAEFTDFVSRSRFKTLGALIENVVFARRHGDNAEEHEAD
jgi:hypothetical protein